MDGSKAQATRGAGAASLWFDIVLGLFRSRLFRFAGLRGRALTRRRPFGLASLRLGLFSLTAVPARGRACAGAP